MTRVQNDLDETKIILVSYFRGSKRSRDKINEGLYFNTWNITSLFNSSIFFNPAFISPI
jgi:hypothetical protein